MFRPGLSRKRSIHITDEKLRRFVSIDAISGFNFPSLVNASAGFWDSRMQSILEISRFSASCFGNTVATCLYH